jgi:LPXTG-motif cell wall-anchored protein
VQEIAYLIFFLILPKGAVRDEATFLAMLAILIVLVIIALILRKRRQKDDT